MTFVETLKNAAVLKRKREEFDRSLTIDQKIDLAQDILKTVKDRQEYLEIEKTIKDLKEERRLQVKGFIKPSKAVLPEEEVQAIFTTAERESQKAQKEYQKLQATVSKAISEYLEKVKEPLNQMKVIEQQAGIIKRMEEDVMYSHTVHNKVVPYGSEGTAANKVTALNDSIKERWGL